METFVYLWQLLESHGVVPGKKDECARLWAAFTLEQQRLIYRSIRDKIRAGKFVHFDPVKAVQENKPNSQRQRQCLSYADYYARYGTTEEADGWQKKYLPDQQRTIYVKS